MLSISSRKIFRKAFLFIAFFFATGFAFAQDLKDDTTAAVISAPVPGNDPPIPPPPIVPTVTKVTSCDPEHPKRSGLGDDIILTLDNPAVFFQDAEEPNTRVVLFVNNKPVRDILYERTADGYRFFMPNEGDVTKLWDYLMASRGKGEFFEKQVSISMGIENLDTLVASSLDPIPTKVDGKPGRTYTLILVHKTWFVVCILVLLGLIIFFIAVANRTDMLRDTGPPPATGRKPYSLARVQMGIWFLVIISSWLLLYVCLHHFDLLNEKILILMGITAGTGVGGLALDTNKGHEVTTPSEGFFKDLISDHSNISLFRFQNFAWTIILVIVFIRTVIVYLRMPEFDMTLLTLMGISSGTYIGAKVTEKRVAEDNPPPANDQPTDQNTDQNT
jgi:hypothetical protein